MANKWLEHLKRYQRAHPKLSYAEAMVQAKKSYKGGGLSFSKNKVKKLAPSKQQESIDEQNDMVQLRRLITKTKPKKVPKRYSTNLGVIPEQNRNFSMGSPRGKVKKAFSAKGLSSSKVKPLSPEEIKAYLKNENEYKKRLIANLEKINNKKR